MLILSSPSHATVAYAVRMLRVTMLLLILSFSSCKKSESGPKLAEPDPQPELTSFDIQTLGPGKAVLKATIKGIGTKVLDHGFVYSNVDNSDPSKATILSLGARSTDGEFSSTIYPSQLGNTDGSKLYAKAYYVGNQGTIYKSVPVVTMPKPVTEQVSPTFGKARDKITLTGAFFTSQSNQIKVLFDEREARILNSGDYKLEVEVPFGLSQKNGQNAKIYVVVDGHKSEAPGNFTVYANVTNFTPKEGPEGTIINFYGDNLPTSGSSFQYITVFFGGKEIKPMSSQSLDIRVPVGAAAQSKITIKGRNYEVELPGEFTLIQ